MLVKKNYGPPTFVQLVGRNIGSSEWVRVPDGLAIRLKAASSIYSFKQEEVPKQKPAPKKEEAKKKEPEKQEPKLDEPKKEEAEKDKKDKPVEDKIETIKDGVGKKGLLKSTFGKDKKEHTE